MVKNAAARRATRRLPLGEPPLVITTHAITSFRSSHPDPAGVQPRAVSGPSPSCHGSTTRKSTERVFGSERHIEFSQQAILDQQATAAKKKTWPLCAGQHPLSYYPGSKEGHIPTRRASEGSGAFPSLARRVNMQQHAELPCRGNTVHCSSFSISSRASRQRAATCCNRESVELPTQIAMMAW